MEYLAGIIVSLIVEFAKKYLKTTEVGTQVVLLILSVVASVVYSLIKDRAWWTGVVQVLTTAAAFHNLIIRPYKKS